MPYAWPTFRQTTTLTFFVVLFASACVMPLQSDFWWHLRAGQEMWSRHFVMVADEFSFTARGAYWPNHEWLSELVFFAVYRLGGLPAVTLLAAACVTGAVALSWRLMYGAPTFKLLLIAAAVPSIVFVWTVRPHVFTLLLLMSIVHLVIRMRYWPLPILFAVWANLHGGVALGLVALGAMTIAEAWKGDRRCALRLAALCAACFAATLATPIGFDLWRTIPESVQKSMANGIMEWRPPVLFGWRDVSFWVTATALVGAVVIRRRRIATREDAALVAVSLALLPLALRYGRNITPFVLLALPALTHLFVPDDPGVVVRSDRGERGLVNAVVLACCAGVCGVAVWRAWSIPASRLQWQPMSEAVIEGVRACPGHVYNRFDDGGYLIWFAKGVPVFVDNRQDPYPLAFLQDHLVTEQTGDYEPVFSRYSMRCAFLPSASPTTSRLRASNWSIVAHDSNWVVLEQ